MPAYQHPSVYSQSSSLLFQFILDEFLIAAQEGAKMSPLYLQLETALLRHRPFREIERLLSQVGGALAILTGSARIHTQIYPWTPSKGALGKLKHYTSVFAPQESRLDASISELAIAASKSYHGALA